LRRISAELGLEEIVRFIGRVKLEEVARYYEAIDIFVYPRRRMRLTELVTPLKPLEAMAHGKPVVASDVGGHRELIRDGDTGYLFPSDNANALAARLETVIANRDDRARVAARGLRFVEQERSWTTIVARYASIYEQLLADSRSKGPREAL
jgi:glycosyltransferase involved in cell wall biosynthesis